MTSSDDTFLDHAQLHVSPCGFNSRLYSKTKLYRAVLSKVAENVQYRRKPQHGGRVHLLDIEQIRRDFPILDTGVIYLDNAASSLTPRQVVHAMSEFYYKYRANVGRGIHRLSQKAGEAYEEARAKISDFINARTTNEIIFTRNTTEAINMIAHGLAWKKGDKIVTSIIEHHSNFIVWLRLKEKFGVDLEIVEPDKQGIFDLADFEAVIDDRTKLVTLTHVSNVLGTISPVDAIAKIAHDYGAFMLVDGAQSVPHLQVDVQRLGCDFLAFSGHKMLGPTGIGVLFMRQNLFERLDPMIIGGGTIHDVGSDHYRLTTGPAKFEAGTPPIAEAIGLGATVDYLNRVTMADVAVHEKRLVQQLHRGLNDVANVEIFGSENLDHKAGIVSFNIGALNPHDVALALDVSANIMVRSGHHCCLPLTREFLAQQEGTVRASPYLYNTHNEVEELISNVNEIAKSLA